VIIKHLTMSRKLMSRLASAWMYGLVIFLQITGNIRQLILVKFRKDCRSAGDNLLQVFRNHILFLDK